MFALFEVAVTFSKSLTDAAENEYVQPLNLTQEENGVTVSVEYLIVDQKQGNAFFRVASEQDAEYEITPDVLTRDKKSASCAYGMKNHDAKNGELRSMTIDFLDEDVPDSLVLELDVKIREEEYGEYYEEILHLREYPKNEVWLKLHYTHSWEAEEPVAILVQE